MSRKANVRRRSVPSRAACEPLETRTLLTGTWTTLPSAPGNVGTMMLLSNGTVLAHLGGDSGGAGWGLLTPNATGSYTAGAWSVLSTMHDSRLYFASQVLQNGNVFVAGGEYGTGAANSEIYNTLTNTWTYTPAPGQGSFLDAGSDLLPNGNVLVAPVAPSLRGYTSIYNPATNAWTRGPKLVRGNSADEQSWVTLPDGSIITIDGNGSAAGTSTSERYIPATNTWVNDATVPAAMFDSLGEIGAAVLLNSGKAFFIGSTGATAIYTPPAAGSASPGSWVAGPSIPGGLGEDDAPAAVLPDGTVLLTGGPIDSYSGPNSFFIYDPATNAMAAVTGAPTTSGPPFTYRMLDLPDGTTLLSTGGSTVYDYKPNVTPTAGAVAAITGITHNADGTYLLSGTQLNGNSQGAAYGDDAQMNTNFPIVRLTGTTGTVYFARTYNWSSTGVDTGTTPETTNFTLPLGLPAGTYTVNVMVNGLISAGVTLTTPAAADTAPTVATPAAASPAAVTGLTTNLSVLGTSANGESTLTYTWATTSAPSGTSTPSFSANGTQRCQVGHGHVPAHRHLHVPRDHHRRPGVVGHQQRHRHRVRGAGVGGHHPHADHPDRRPNPAVRGRGVRPVRRAVDHPADVHLGRGLGRRHGDGRRAVHGPRRRRAGDGDGHDRLPRRHRQRLLRRRPLGVGRRRQPRRHRVRLQHRPRRLHHRRVRVRRLRHVRPLPLRLPNPRRRRVDRRQGADPDQHVQQRQGRRHDPRLARPGGRRGVDGRRGHRRGRIPLPHHGRRQHRQRHRRRHCRTLLGEARPLGVHRHRLRLGQRHHLDPGVVGHDHRHRPDRRRPVRLGRQQRRPQHGHVRQRQPDRRQRRLAHRRPRRVGHRQRAGQRHRPRRHHVDRHGRQAGAKGTVVNNGDGTVTYTANAAASGQDTFTYTISDGVGDTASATVTVGIQGLQAYYSSTRAPAPPRPTRPATDSLRPSPTPPGPPAWPAARVWPSTAPPATSPRPS